MKHAKMKVRVVGNLALIVHTSNDRFVILYHVENEKECL